MGIEEISIPTTEIEADGFITPPSALERKTERTAKPISECVYPKCEECDKYHGHYCTVPMVVSKQIYRETMERIGKLEKTLAELENLVIDEIFTQEIEVEVGKNGKLYRKDRKPCIVIREPKGNDK